MTEWERLLEKAKSPEQRLNERAAEAASSRQEAVAAAAAVITSILGVFKRTVTALGRKLNGGISHSEGSHGIALEFPNHGHKIEAKRETGTVVLTIDGEPLRFEYRDGLFVAAGFIPIRSEEFEDIVLKQVNSWIP